MHDVEKGVRSDIKDDGLEQHSSAQQESVHKGPVDRVPTPAVVVMPCLPCNRSAGPGEERSKKHHPNRRVSVASLDCWTAEAWEAEGRGGIYAAPREAKENRGPVTGTRAGGLGPDRQVPDRHVAAPPASGKDLVVLASAERCFTSPTRQRKLGNRPRNHQNGIVPAIV